MIGASAMAPEEIARTLDPPFARFGAAERGDDFAGELATVSAMWFSCGYRPGIAAYLNFFLLADFVALHDRSFPPRFESFRSMATSFYRTDLFVRAVTDSGPEATGGISARAVRQQLGSIMARHRAVDIPAWMMTYFGFSLVEAVEKQCEPLTDEQRARHLAYMARTYRIMGMPFSADRERMTAFARATERAHAGVAPQLETHARRILLLGEMVGAPSEPGAVLELLPAATRDVFAPMAPRMRPSLPKRLWARAAGRLLMPRAIGVPRAAIPVDELDAA
jgi:hypothetical protein